MLVLTLLLHIGFAFNAVVALNAYSKSANSKLPDPFKYRLPKEIIPLSYNVTLKVNPSDLVFEGESSVTFNITKSITNIPIHVDDISINIITLTKCDETTHELFKVFVSYRTIKMSQYITINFGSILLPGLYTMNMTFRGDLNITEGGFSTEHVKR